MSTPTAEPAAGASIEIGHRLPDGKVEIYDDITRAVFGMSMFGGDVVWRNVGAWQLAPERFQYKWVNPE